MKDAIAREIIRGQTPDGANIEILIQIGAPHPYGQRANEWICRVDAPKLQYADAGIHGGSALQALGLALSAVRKALIYFREDGGKLGYEPGQDDYDIVATFGLGDLAARQ